MDGRRRGLRGFVAYRGVGGQYIERRRLTRYAGVWSLWALGVGAVISGNFFGWHFGLSVAGISGMMVATAVVAVMFLCICFSVAEMAAAMPFTGGAYCFARTAFGPWVGYVTGLAELAACVLAPAVIVVVVGSYVGTVTNSLFGLSVAPPVWWLILYVVFVAINIAGVGVAFRVAVVLTFLALELLALFWLRLVAPEFTLDGALALSARGPQTRNGCPTGWLGVAQALPFAAWFFLAIGQLPLAAEESRRPGRGPAPGPALGHSGANRNLPPSRCCSSPDCPGVGPAVTRQRKPTGALFGFSVNPAVPALMLVGGLAAGFHALTYACGRRIYSLSRSGYLPRWLSITRGPTRTPYLALIAGAALGYGAALSIELGEDWLGGHVPAAAVLLNMAVFGAVIAYFLQMVSFVRLRRRYPGLDRRYVSPLASAGAALAALIAGATLVFMLLNTDYWMGILGCGAFFVAGLLYFAAFSYRRLVISPEENYALRLEEEERR